MACPFFRVQAALTWNLVDVDTTGSVSLPDLALDSSGNPHITYYEGTNQKLKYAKWTGTSWNIQTVDTESGYDVSQLALDSTNTPHVLYSKWSGGQLRYAVLTGSTWNVQTISQPSWVDSPGIAIDKTGNIHIIFRTNLILNYAKLVGSSWTTETVETAGRNGYGSSLTTDSNGNPHISYVAYVEDGKEPLKYAKKSGSTWTIQTVDSSGICFYTSLTLDSNGNPHISYSYKATQTSSDIILKYAKWSGSAWNIQTVVSTNIGYFTSIVLDSNNNPQICYDDYSGSLKYTKWSGSAWSTQTVDQPNAQSGSMVLHSTGNPRIAYSSNPGLKYAELIDPEVTTPIPELTSFVIIATIAAATLLSMIVAHATGQKRKKHVDTS